MKNKHLKGINDHPEKLIHIPNSARVWQSTRELLGKMHLNCSIAKIDKVEFSNQELVYKRVLSICRLIQKSECARTHFKNT